MPAPSASRTEWEAYLKRSNDAVLPILKTQGIPMYPGTAALFDSKTGTLSVRGTQPWVDLIEAYSDQLVSMAPRHLELSLEVLEVSEERIGPLLEEASILANHTELLARLKEPGQAKVAAQPLRRLRLETVSGQRARAEEGVTLSDEASTGRGIGRSEGLRFEARPVLLADGTTIELEYDFEYGPAAEAGKAWQGSRSSGVVLRSSVLLPDGATKILGAWRASGAEDGSGNKVRIAFLRTRAVLLVHDINPLVETKLRELVGAPPVGKPREVVPRRELPHGMEQRVFAVPRNFLQGGGVSFDRGELAYATKSSKPVEPADPFAPSVSPDAGSVDFLSRDDDRPLHRAKIAFPEGSSASYVPKDSTLWIVNNAEGIKRVAEFVEEMWRQIPRTLVCRVEVIEAETSLMQAVADATSGIGSHGRGKEILERMVKNQQARVVERHRLETLNDKPCELYSLNPLTGAFEVEMRAVLGPNERMMDLEVTLRQGKGTGMQVGSNTRLAMGEPRMVALWNPSDEGDGKKEISRAVFVTADLVPIEQPVKTKIEAKQGTMTHE
ncbi:hypothetical protein [Roseimicrobium gellanilyticum]|nr:hypothetical protein [Roseimicrobium gellanilyticum]